MSSLLGMLKARPSLHRIIENSGWMMGEQVLRLIGGLLIGILIARHLGVARFGELSFAIAFTGLFGIIGTLGLNRIAVREFVTANAKGEDTQAILDNILKLRLAVALGLMVLAIAISWLFHQGTLLLIAIMSPMFLFSSFDIIDLWFQSQSRARTTSAARCVSYLLALGFRTILLATHAGVGWFAVATLLEYAGAAVALLTVYLRNRPRISIHRFDPLFARQLIGESWSEIIGGFAGLLYIRLDQIMLGNFLGDRAVGIFAVASRLSEAWYFIPIALVSSTFPSIVRVRETDPDTYLRRLSHLMRILVAISYAAIAATTVLAPFVVTTLYGTAFRQSATILTIHIWCGLFMSLGLASGSWIMAERRTRLNLYRNLSGAAVNIALNLFVIPRYGPIGASFATLFSLFTAFMLFDIFVPSMRDISRAKWRALLLLPSSVYNQHRPRPDLSASSTS